MRPHITVLCYRQPAGVSNDEKVFFAKKGQETLIFRAKKCMIYANEMSYIQINAKMLLNLTKMSKKKKQFDGFEQ